MSNPSIARFTCTKEQQEVFEQTLAEAEEIFKRLCVMTEQVHAVIDQGPAMNGARRYLSNLKEATFFAAQALNLVFDGPNRGRDYFPFMVIRNRQARGNLGLPGWMQRLIDKHNGIPPETWTNADITEDPK